MSQPQADDPDPLLEFSSERSAVIQVPSAPKASPQPVEAPVDPAPALPRPSPSISTEALLARINRLESALVDSKFQVSTLKSELATLVRAIGDIKKQSWPEKSPEIGLPSALRAPKLASALLVALVVLSSGVFGWVYFTGAAQSTLVGSVPESQEVAFVPADQPVAPAELERPSSPPPPVRVSAREPARAPARCPPDARTCCAGSSRRARDCAGHACQILRLALNRFATRRRRSVRQPGERRPYAAASQRPESGVAPDLGRARRLSAVDARGASASRSCDPALRGSRADRVTLTPNPLITR